MHAFEEMGLAGLLEGERSGRPRRLNEEQLEGIGRVLRRMPREMGLGGNLWDGKTLAAWIQREYGISLGVRQCQRLFRQLRFRLRKPRPAIAPETKDPVLLHPPTRRSVGYFGAVRLRDGQFLFRRETDRFNAITFWGFLRALRGMRRRKGRRVVVITDNAKYHHALLHKDGRERHAADFALDYLPPYSPELNPIERVWKLTRRRCLQNRYFARLEEIIEVVEAEFANWTQRNDTLRRVCAIT